MKNYLPPSLKRISLIGIFMFSLLFLSNCKKEATFSDGSSTFDRKKIVTRFFDIKKDADPELIALAKDIKKQDSLSHFLTKFVKKNGYPVWDKVNYQTKINNQAIVYANSTKSTDDVKLSTGVFLIPCVDEKTKYVKSYIVAKKLKADTYSYQLYNREELSKVHVPDSLKSALIGTQAVFGYFEKEINNINQINITNPTNKSIKNFYLKFVEQPKNKKKVNTNGVSIQESICKTATYYIQVTVDTTIGTSTELWEVTVRQCEEIPSSGSGSGSTFPSNGLGGTYPTSDPNNPFNPFYAPSPYSLDVPISPGEFLIQKLVITDVYQQGFLKNYLEISTELVRYLTINGFTQENEDFITWAIGYLYGNRNVNFEDFKQEYLLNKPNINDVVLPELIDTTGLSPYPKFKEIITNLPAFLNAYPNVRKALAYYTGFTESEVMSKMQPGKGPKIEILNNLGVNVYGHYDALTKTLQISSSFVNGLEVAQLPKTIQATGLLLAITTFHEFVHYGRDINILRNKYQDPTTGDLVEAGWTFEYSIDPNGVGINKYNAIKWLNFYPYNF